MKYPFLHHRLLYYYFFLVSGIVYLIAFTKEEGFLLINNMHNSFLDNMMPLITLLGDGILVFTAGIVLLFFRFRLGFYVLISYSVSGIIAQVLKRLVFSDFSRPVAWFNEMGISLYTLPDLDIPLKYSFPSGHTTTAFAFLFGISFFSKKWYLSLILLFLSVVTAFSRVYLAMHFPVDVVAGSLIGVITAIVIFLWIQSWKKSWLDLSLISVMKREVE